MKKGGGYSVLSMILEEQHEKLYDYFGADYMDVLNGINEDVQEIVDKVEIKQEEEAYIESDIQELIDDYLYENYIDDKIQVKLKWTSNIIESFPFGTLMKLEPIILII